MAPAITWPRLQLENITQNHYPEIARMQNKTKGYPKEYPSFMFIRSYSDHSVKPGTCSFSWLNFSFPYESRVITTNNTGTIKIASEVAASIPPRTVQPMVDLATLAAPVARASGKTPRINAREVMSIGRRRSLTASRVAVDNRYSPVHTLFGKFHDQDCIFCR